MGTVKAESSGHPLTLTLSEPRSLGASFAKVFFGVGLTLPVVTGVLSVAFFEAGLIKTTEVYPWDQVLSVLFLLALFITPESICVYLFQNQIIKKFLTRMMYIVLVVFVYANYIFLIPGDVYTFLPVAGATLLWALWPPVVTLVLGFVVGRIESGKVFTSETMFSRGKTN